MVTSVWEAEKDTAILNPGIRQRCPREIRAFCPDVEAGEHRLLVCMVQHFNETGFGEGCRRAVTSLGANFTVPAIVRLAGRTTTIFQKMRRSSFWDTWGK